MPISVGWTFLSAYLHKSPLSSSHILRVRLTAPYPPLTTSCVTRVFYPLTRVSYKAAKKQFRAHISLHSTIPLTWKLTPVISSKPPGTTPPHQLLGTLGASYVRSVGCVQHALLQFDQSATTYSRAGQTLGQRD